MRVFFQYLQGDLQGVASFELLRMDNLYIVVYTQNLVRMREKKLNDFAEL